MQSAGSNSTTRPPGILFVAVLVLIVSFGFMPADATAGSIPGWAPLAGFSTDPDQFTIGGYVDFGEIGQNFHLLASGAVGFGDDAMLVSVGPDLVVELPLQDLGELVLGAGIAVVYLDWEDAKGGGPFRDRPVGDHSDTDLSALGIAGYKYSLGKDDFVLDVRFGFSDEFPAVRMMAGYQFNLR